MSELRDRLERLAARGTRRGAENVLRAAMRDVPRDVPSLSGVDGADLEIVDDNVPFVTMESVARRRGRFATLIAATGAAALVGVGALAVTAMFGSGGAGSPEGAVRQLADAVSHKDPLAAVDVLVPTEVRSMRETVKHVTQRAADLKIVDQASEPLAGVDLSVDHLQLSTETLADGYVKVIVTGGELSASTHRAAMSKLLQDAIRNADTGDTQGKVNLARLASGSHLPTFVVTVRHDGRWYVSPAYTALEYAREVAGGPAAAFGSAHAADLGADTPEAAVSDALHAWQAGNWDRLMALAPPDELPVYDYRAWINEAEAQTHPDFTIDKLSTNATVSGDTAIVKLEASGTTGSGADRGTWQVGGTCPAIEGGWFGYSSSYSSSTSGFAVSNGTSSNNVASPQTSRICIAGDLGRVVPFRLVAAGAQIDAPATGAISIEVVREDGRWFVSPVSTVLDAVNSFVDHIDERGLYPLIGLGYLLPPDGTIILDQPFSVAGGSSAARVYAFDGTKGQRVVGGSSGSQNGYVQAQLYKADGADVGLVSFNSYYSGDPIPLPSTGSYRLVVIGGVPNGAELTLWDANNAPKQLLTPSEGPGFVNRGASCKPIAGGGESCTSTTIVSPSGILGGNTAKAVTAPLRAPRTTTPLTTVP